MILRKSSHTLEYRRREGVLECVCPGETHGSVSSTVYMMQNVNHTLD